MRPGRDHRRRPAGRAWAVHRAGIDTLILESRSQEYVLARVRARACSKAARSSVRARRRRRALQGRGPEARRLRPRVRRRAPPHRPERLTGRSVTVHGQTEITKDPSRRAPKRARRSSTRRARSSSTTSIRKVPRQLRWAARALRFHRRLRRLPRGLARVGAARGDPALRARLPLRLARHPRTPSRCRKS